MSLTLFVATHVIILASDLSTRWLTPGLHRIDFVYSDLFFALPPAGYLSANTRATYGDITKDQNKT